MASPGWLRYLLHRLRFRLLVLLMLALAPAFILQILHAWSERRTQMQWVQQDTQSSAEIRAGTITQYVEGARKLSSTLAAFPGVRRADYAACTRLFEQLLPSYPEFINIGFIDLEGIWRSAGRPMQLSDNGQPPSVAGVSWFEECKKRQRFTVGGFRIGVAVRRPLLPFGFPVYDETGKLNGIITVGLNLDVLQKSLARAPLPAGSELLVFDREGLVLAHLPEAGDWLGRNGALMPGVREMLKIHTGVVQEKTARGEPLVIGFSPVPNSDMNSLSVQIRRPANKAFEPIDHALCESLISLAAGGLLALAAAWVGSDAFVLRQLRALRGAASKLARGDLQARSLAPQGIEEVNELARTFDEMAQQLEARETERRMVLAALRDSEDQLRALSAHLQTVREQESTRIARELHDELGQVLAAMRINLATLRDSALSKEEQAARIAELGELANETIQRVRRICAELRPGVLDELGAVAALQWLAEDFETRSGLPCTFLCRAESITLPPEATTALFRTCQEALTNVMRHSDASSVTIELAETEDSATLRIRDDGHGFDVTSVRPGQSFGILGMRERVALAGGRFSLVSIPAVGTTISVSFAKEPFASEPAAVFFENP